MFNKILSEIERKFNQAVNTANNSYTKDSRVWNEGQAFAYAQMHDDLSGDSRLMEEYRKYF